MPDQDWAIYRTEAQRLIDRMPADRRSALLQISAGVSYEQAATSLGCEVGTIKSRVNRARATLIAELGDIFKIEQAYSA
jgi:RNA polymerase sigma-70 factor (ECF subfamily)